MSPDEYRRKIKKGEIISMGLKEFDILEKKIDKFKK